MPNTSNSESSDAECSSDDELLNTAGQHPLDLDHIPSSFQVDDHVSQDELLQAIFQPSIIPEHERDLYEKLPPHTVRLSWLKDTYEKKRTQLAIESLEKRLKIKVDSALQCVLEDDNLLWDVNVNRLDYIVTVADKIGLWPILPRVTSDHTYTFNLDLSKPYKDFKAKYARLGFDPKGSMLFIGTCRNDDIWLALVPHTFSQGVGRNLAAGFITGDPRLSTSHYRMAVMFFAAALASIPDRGFVCHNKYGINLNSSSSDFSMYTNVLDVRVNTDLRLNDVQRLSRWIIANWDTWVESAPRSWHSDGFLRNVVPIVVTSRYGQNQPICESHNREDERIAWQRERHWSNIRYITLALATHLSATFVDDWITICSDNILDEHDEIYDSCDKRTRNLINNLSDLPLHDEHRKEVRIYDETGRKIARRGASINMNSSACGLLVNLKTISSLFTSPNDLDVDDELDDESDSGHARPPQTASVPLYLYPQAYLRDYGHIQAKGTMSILNPIINEINGSCLPTNEFPDDDCSSDVYEEARFGVDPVVTGISSQMYNAVQHRASTNAGSLDVQQGRITATLAGSYVTSKKNTKIAERHLGYCRTKLPHNRFKDRIQHEECPTALRVENVYSVDITQLSPGDRDGDKVYSIICSLVDAWQRPEFQDQIKPKLIVFRPGVFPNIYNWVTYGICSLLQIVARQEFETVDLTKQGGRQVGPYVLEFSSALERALAYAHTGNVKVLSSGVMKPLFLARAMVEMGMPTIIRGVYELPFLGATPFVVNPHAWPLTTNRRGPAICSKSSHMINYGEDHYMAYEAEFRIQHALHTPNERFSDKIANKTLRQCVLIAEVAFTMYFRDVRQMVKAGVEADINAGEGRGDDEQSTERKKKLKKWLRNGEGIMDFEHDNYAVLLRAIVTTPEEVAKGLPGMAERQITTMVFATKLYNMVTNRRNNPLEAPILLKGTFYPALKVAIKHIVKTGGEKIKPTFVIGVLRLTTELLKVRFVPWKGEQTGRGHPQRNPLWNSWISLGGTNQMSEQRTISLRPDEALHRAALDAQRVAIARDANMPWNTVEMNLTDLLQVLDNPMLPSDWAIPQQSTEYVKATYEYVRDTYDCKKPLHRLALLVGIVMSRSIPSIFPPSDLPDRLTTKMSRTETRRVAQGLPWVSRTKTKGMKDGSIFMTMFMTFIIALYESESPLREYLKTHPTLGPAWTEKHRPKAVMAFTLLRLGLVWAEGLKACQAGRFGAGWGVLGMKDISNLLTELLWKMKSQPYGIGDALTILLGAEKAREVGIREGVQVRTMAGGSKRPHEMEEENESEEEGHREKSRRRQ